MQGGKKKTLPAKTIPSDLVYEDKGAELRKAYLSAKKVVIPEKTAEQKLKDMKKSEPISKYLKNCKVQFSKDLDTLWDTHDTAGNSYLDKSQSEKFIEEIAGAIEGDRAYNYDKSQFKELFDRFDDNKDKVLSKGEMAQFIKYAFRKTNAMINKDKAKEKKAN